jgi:hypothetical protein
MRTARTFARFSGVTPQKRRNAATTERAPRATTPDKRLTIDVRITFGGT